MFYMGYHIRRNRKACELKLHQYLYVDTVVKTFGNKKESRIPGAFGVSTLS